VTPRPTNQSGTHAGYVTPRHPKPKPKPKPKPAAKRPASTGGAGGKGKYDWGDGKGRAHSIPLATHNQHEQAKALLGGNLDLTAPPSGLQAVQEAQSAADLQFGPQIQAAQQLQANIAPWFQDYLARVAGYAQAARSLSAPVLQQASSYQQGAAAQTPAGVDPNSQAGQQAAQAAQGRQALAQLGLDALNTNATATQDYFGGQQNIAARVQPQMEAAAGQSVANAKTQRGNAVDTFLTTARQNAQNYAIARGTLGLNTNKAAADVDLARGVDPVTGRPLPKPAARPESPYSSGPFAGLTPSQVRALPDARKAQMRKDYQSGQHPGSSKPGGLTPAQKRAAAKEKAKHVGALDAATGKIQTQVQDVIDKWNTFAHNGQVDDTAKPIPDPQGRKPGTTGYKPTYKQRAPTPDEIKGELAKQGYSPQMIHIALLVRVGKPLDQAAINYLHNLDPNIRIPRDWLGPRSRGVYAGGPGDPKPTSGQQNGLGGK
jgi:hypothetical protein